ncbi:hypothetical protein MUB15_20660 [Priestia sp. OVS21]|nr:hypothetical protein [Priestia sp. OVS21]
MELYVLADHLHYISRHSDSDMQRAAKKFSSLLKRYLSGKEYQMIANSYEFDKDTKVVIMNKNNLEIASFKKYDQKLAGHEVTIDLDIEVIPYKNIQKVEKKYYKPSLNEELLIFSAVVHLNNGHVIPINPVNAPNESTPESFLFGTADNAPFQQHLTNFINDLEGKV